MYEEMHLFLINKKLKDAILAFLDRNHNFYETDDQKKLRESIISELSYYENIYLGKNELLYLKNKIEDEFLNSDNAFDNANENDETFYSKSEVLMYDKICEFLKE